MTNHSCYLLRPPAPPFQNMKINPLNLVTFLQTTSQLANWPALGPAPPTYLFADIETDNQNLRLG